MLLNLSFIGTHFTHKCTLTVAHTHTHIHTLGHTYTITRRISSATNPCIALQIRNCALCLPDVVLIIGFAILANVCVPMYACVFVCVCVIMRFASMQLIIIQLKLQFA